MGGAQNPWMEAKQESCLLCLSQESCLQYTPLESKTRILSLVYILHWSQEKQESCLQYIPLLSFNQAKYTKDHTVYVARQLCRYIGSSRQPTITRIYACAYVHAHMYEHSCMCMRMWMWRAHVNCACTCELCMYGNSNLDRVYNLLLVN